jgi:hypothetical protein
MINAHKTSALNELKVEELFNAYVRQKDSLQPTKDPLR